MTTKRQLQAHQLCVEQGMTFDEAGGEMGITRSAVCRLLTRLASPMPPKRQLQAYRLLYIEGYSRDEAMALMHIGKSTINRLLSRFFLSYPSLRPDPSPPRTVRVGDWSSFNQTKIVHKF